MNLLWSLEELTRWSRHDSTDVRYWALGNLKEYYPRQSGAALAARLGDGDPEIALMAAGHFVDFPDARFADVLLAAFEGAEDPDFRGSCAQALAAIHDGRFAQRYWEDRCFGNHPLRDDPGVLEASMRLRLPAAREWLRCFVAEAEAQARRASVKGELKEIGARLDAAAESLLLGNPLEEIPFLLDHYLRWPNHELLGYRLLRALAAAAGDYSTAEDFEEETQRSKPSRLSLMEETALEDLISSGETELATRARRLLKEGDDLSFISLVASRAEALLEEECGGMAEERRTAWLGSGQIPAFNLQLLRSLCAVRSEIASARKPVRHRLAMLGLSAFCRYAMCGPLLGRSFEELAPAQKIQFLLKDRYSLREDDDWILQIGPGDATLTELEQCSRVLQDDGDRAQGRAAALAGHLRYAPALPILLDLLGTEDDLLWEDLLTAASRFGAAVAPFLEKAARDGTSERLMQMLPLLDELPCRETEEFLVRHFPRIYDLDADSARLAAETFGTRSMIPLIRGVMKPGEPEEEIYALLCQLHDVAAPELPGIIESVAARREESKRRLYGFSAGNLRAALSNTVPLALKCERCGRAYHYDVHRVHVDAGAPPGEGIFIQDSIVCKNCGARDSYEITGGATLAIMGAVLTSSFAAKAGQGDPQEGPVRMVESRVDGKPMSIAQGERYYQELIAQSPDQPELRVGYGNLLRNLHRPEQACREYEKALELDPLAVEAWVGLGEMENKAGNLRHARDFYSRALDLFDRGNFFRLTTHPEDLREQLEINVDRLTEQILDSEPGHSFQEDWTPPAARPLNVGRNDPCPCGSGKKYKKCCLGKKAPAAATAAPDLPKTMTTAAEARLHQRLSEFSTQPRFKRQFDQALEIFFSEKGVMAEEDVPPSQAELGEFIEWFIHDYAQEPGGTLLEIFQRTDGRLLPVTERAILEEQRKSVLSLYEVLEAHPERAEIRIRNLFTDEEFVAHDVAGSRQLVQWDLIISRLMRIEGRLRLSGIISTLAPAQRNALLRYANLAWEAFQRETGQKDLNAFQKARGYCFYQFVRAEKQRPPQMPELLTSDHHALLFCKGVYNVRNYHGAVFRLKEAPDFDLEGGVDGGVKDNELRFVWLRRGPSRDIVPEGRLLEGLQVETSRLATQHSHPIPVLGNVTFKENEMVLEAFSRERLEAGKQRLEALLGGYVALKLETLQTPKALSEEAFQKAGQVRTPKTGLPPEVERSIAESFLRNHYERWIDESLPALDGKTPRQAVATAEGRARVEDLIKNIENSEARKRLNQEPSVDLSFLRQRLSATAK